MKTIIASLLLALFSWHCSTPKAVLGYNRIKHVDTCEAKIVNLKYYTMKPPTPLPLERKLYQYWRVDKINDSTAVIRLVYDTLYYSDDIKEWFKIK